MKHSTLTLSGIIGVSMLTLGVLGISHVDARAMAGDNWSSLSPRGRLERINTWKSKHQKRAEAMDRLLTYLELDEVDIKELQQTGTSLAEYIRDNGYDMDTVRSVFREGILAHLDEMREYHQWSGPEYHMYVDAIDSRIDKALHRVGKTTAHWNE